MTEIKKTCSTCRFLYVPSEVAPCGKCAIVSEWKPKSPTWDEVGPELLVAVTRGTDCDFPTFLDWVADRLVNVYDESPNVDFVHTLRDRADCLRAAIARAKEITE